MGNIIHCRDNSGNDHDDRALRLAAQAADLACRIRDEDPADIHADIGNMNHAYLVELVTVMAAMIPDDKPVSELLAWIAPPSPKRYAVPVSDLVRRGHAAHVAGERSEWAVTSEREYQRARWHATPPDERRARRHDQYVARRDRQAG
jgi:hypothetical protein